MTEIEKLQKQHYDNYRKAINEIVKNNTNSLIDDDIISLIKEPPLDSMDQIKGKFLSLAKKENIILNAEKLNFIISKFRSETIKEFQNIKKIRIDSIIDSIEKSFSKGDKIVKITKKQLTTVNSSLKKCIKNKLNNCVEDYLINQLNDVFMDNEDNSKIIKIKNEITKFLSCKGSYQKQALENIDFKILVKDIILINGIKEQNERYIFTLNNSRLFSN